MFDIFAHYFPTADELSPAELQDAHARCVAWLRPAAPTLNMSPGSPFGAAALLPLVRVIAGLEIAMDRIRNDLTTANVAAGTVYDCAFVESYLRALGGRRQESVEYSGHVILEFANDADINIPAGVQFLFNSADVLLPRVEQQQSIHILRSGSVRRAPNDFVLTPFTSSTFAVLVPVRGTPQTDITAGTTAVISQEVSGLVAITAAYLFIAGRSNNSVQAIARRATQSFAASGFITRDGIREQLLQVWPDLLSVSSALSGDAEQLRGATNALGIAAGAADIVVRSAAKTEFTQTVRLDYFAEQDGVAVDKFIGVWRPVATPIRLADIRWTGNSGIDLRPTEDSAYLLSRSTNPAKAPLLTSAFSELEELTFVVSMPRSVANVPLLTTEVDAAGQAYALFDVTFVGDPAVADVQRYVDAETPAGVDVLVRAPCPIVFSHLELGYTKVPGQLFNLAQAIDETQNYLRALSAPARFSASRLHDIAYYAGAEDVNYTSVTARLLLTLARYVLPADAADPTTSLTDCLADALLVDSIVLSDVLALVPSYRDPRMGTADTRMGVASYRNVSYELPSNVVSFQPHLTV